MIDVFPFSGYSVAVLGLGASGLSTARALMSSGAEVWAWDDDEKARKYASKFKIPLINLYEKDFSETTTLVVSPGIPITKPQPHPIVSLALEARCEIIGDAELLARTQRDAAYIGITGTNGKSTTTALVGHIMQTCGREAEVGGNLGIPCLELESLGSEGTYILEMSSYQLDLTYSITFDIGVLLNISPDHLERHGGMEGYIKAKRQLFHRQTRPRTAVISVDDENCKRIFEELLIADEQNVIPISGYKPVSGGVFAKNGILYDDTEGSNTMVTPLTGITALPGEHNYQNAAASYAACKMAGVHPSVIQACMQSYPGLAHRQEAADLIDGIAFVNDSKATNPDAAARALACYRNIYWILGGRPKSDDLGSCLKYIDRVRHVFLIGEGASQFAPVLEGKTKLTISGKLEEAVISAFNMAKSDSFENPVILLSPACASYDQFSNFEERGDKFKLIAEGIIGEHLDPFENADIFSSVEN